MSNSNPSLATAEPVAIETLRMPVLHAWRDGGLSVDDSNTLLTAIDELAALRVRTEPAPEQVDKLLTALRHEGVALLHVETWDRHVETLRSLVRAHVATWRLAPAWRRVRDGLPSHGDQVAVQIVRDGFARTIGGKFVADDGGGLPTWSTVGVAWDVQPDDEFLVLRPLRTAPRVKVQP